MNERKIADKINISKQMENKLKFKKKIRKKTCTITLKQNKQSARTENKLKFLESKEIFIYTDRRC